MSDASMEMTRQLRELTNKVERLSSTEKTRITNRTPANGVDTGRLGDICWDTNYIYICTAANYWERAAIANW